MLSSQNQKKASKKSMQLDVTYLNDLPVAIKQEDELIIEDANHNHAVTDENEIQNKHYQHQSVSMDVDEQLIEEVRRREVLYDLGHVEYKNVKIKELAWRQVGSAVEMSETECKKRWKGLRDSYKRCKRAEQVASGGTAKVPKKTWKYFEALTFLDKVSSSRNTVGNVSFAPYEEELAEILDESSDEFVGPTSICSTSMRQTKKNDSDRFQKFLEFAAASITETCGAVAKKEDATDLFFLGLAAKVKAANMPPSVLNKLEAKLAASVFAEIDEFLAQQK